MIAIPAIDLRGGRVVQLVGGLPGSERISLPDPDAVARAWVRHGFALLHVVDLDAALGAGDNRAAIEAVLRAVDVPVQVGGGVRTDSAADAWFAAGAARIVVGTRAVEDRRWLAQLAERYPGCVIVAADVRERMIVTHGWTASTALDAVTFIGGLKDIPLAGVLVTDVGREGRMEGADVVLFETLVNACPCPLMSAGGIADSSDLAALESVGVHAAVLGMALYTGAIDAPTTARSYSS